MWTERWYEPQTTGLRLLLVRLGTVAGIIGWLCLAVVVALFLIGIIAAHV